MAPAFPAFKYKAPGTFLQKNIQQRARRDMEKGSDARLLQSDCLCRSAPCDQNEGGGSSLNVIQLFFTQLRVGKAEYANSPGFPIGAFFCPADQFPGDRKSVV